MNRSKVADVEEATSVSGSLPSLGGSVALAGRPGHRLARRWSAILADRAGPSGRGAVTRRIASSPLASSPFAGFRFPPDVIVAAVRWYLRYGLPYRDVEEPLAERGVDVDDLTIYRWVQRFTPLLIDAARPCRPLGRGPLFAAESYVKVAGVWRYVYRAVDQFGQVIDISLSLDEFAFAAPEVLPLSRGGGGSMPSPIAERSRCSGRRRCGNGTGAHRRSPR